ncbi:MAG TPA: alpha/beta hydrolase [Gemmatimonadaceae bacterium]|nr:alpha/beta hydrolase [Gemmatimonadaceae bacterium]
MFRTLLIALGAAALVLLLLLGAAAHWQERIVWQPPRVLLPDPVGWDGLRRVAYAAADGQRLVGYLVVPSDGDGEAAATWEEGSGHVLVVFHGNAETAPMRLDWARRLADETGWGVFLAEYRGYAGLEGRPTYEGSQLDARAAYSWVRDSLGVPPGQIGIFGFSLGTAVATELASEVEPPVLVLQAPFTSVRDMARAGAVWPLSRLWPLVERVHFDTRTRVAALDAPVWVIHGGRDRIVPTWMGRAVHDAARRQGRYVEVPRAGHNDLPEVGGRVYWTWLTAALASATAAGSPAPSAGRRGGRGGG